MACSIERIDLQLKCYHPLYILRVAIPVLKHFQSFALSSQVLRNNISTECVGYSRTPLKISNVLFLLEIIFEFAHVSTQTQVAYINPSLHNLVCKALICAGPISQQPPMIDAPFCAQLIACSAYCSGLIS